MAQVKVERNLRNEKDIVEVSEIVGTDTVKVENPIEFGSSVEVDGKLQVNSSLLTSGEPVNLSNLFNFGFNEIITDTPEEFEARGVITLYTGDKIYDLIKKYRLNGFVFNKVTAGYSPDDDMVFYITRIPEISPYYPQQLLLLGVLTQGINAPIKYYGVTFLLQENATTTNVTIYRI